MNIETKMYNPSDYASVKINAPSIQSVVYIGPDRSNTLEFHLPRKKPNAWVRFWQKHILGLYWEDL